MSLRQDDLAVGSALLLQLAALATLVLLPAPGTAAAVLLGLAVLASAAYFYLSLAGRKRWQSKQAERRAQLDTAMQTCDVNAEQAFETARAQFHSLRQGIGQAYDIIGTATSRLTGNLTGLEQHSMSQMEMLRQLVESLVQSTHGAEQQKQIAGIKRFAKDTEIIVDHLIGFMSQVQEAGTLTASNFSRMEELMAAVVHFLNSVNEVTKQTDLLALNAAIEAA
ncbi:MAG: hypothetical protein JNJ60_07435, partial [Rhodocyclaceae bacterium]|nr:hypothetical protein [Rhodocyclaceae bacterium]